MKIGEYQKLDEALYIWFRQQREKACLLVAQSDGEGQAYAPTALFRCREIIYSRT